MIHHRSLAASLVVLALVSGCASKPVPLVNVTGGGEQWVWPFFLDGKPTVLAFWNTNEMQCLRDVAALKTLDARTSGVELVTVVTGRDRAEVQKWLGRERIQYVVLLDLDERLAESLHVVDYPTFIYYDTEGKEITRVTDIRLVHNWFDKERWLVRSGAMAPPAWAVSWDSGRARAREESTIEENPIEEDAALD
jgi:hypothetical protein